MLLFFMGWVCLVHSAAVYTRDETGKEIYPTTENGREVVVEGRFARKADGRFYYPKDERGNEYMERGFPLLRKGGIYMYPLTSDGTPNFPPGPEGQEYVRMEGRFILGTDASFRQVYARKGNGDEYYPPDNATFARVRGMVFYAKTADNQTVFPTTPDGDEFYITAVSAFHPRTIPTRYAKTKEGRELYPYEYWNYPGIYNNVLLNNTYAMLESGHPYYPMDRYNNQFYREDGNATKGVLKRYAVTNDGYVILPEWDGDYYDVRDEIPESAVLGHLVRDPHRLRDFLTRIKAVEMPSRLLESYGYVVEGRELKVRNPLVGLFRECG